MPSPTASQHSIPSVFSIESSQSASSSSTRPSLHYEALPDFRTVKPLPYELREHCIIYFEESLCLHLLTSALSPGATSASSRPALVPPPQQLAFVATLAIHPTLTTRAPSDDRLEASILALKYLRLVLHLVGPVHGNLRDAFAFSTAETSSRRSGARRRTTGDESSPSKDDLNSIDNDLATVGSVWARAQDFWHVVGWVFNCSVLHARRWERWRLWLEYMMDTLEIDWAQRVHIHEEKQDGQQDPRERSIIVQYLKDQNARRILRAIFADGSTKYTAEFPEIWRNETKERKKDADVPKKSEAKLDIEADNWGDYMQDASSSELEDTPPPTSPSKTTPSTDSTFVIPDVSASFGGPESIVLRLRLLSLLSTVSVFLPHTFTPLISLYDLYLENIRPLPLPTFFLFISPSSMQHFHQAAASSITQIILRSLIASSAPSPFSDDMTQATLEDCYLPYPANTGSISDNAKVSLCVETLVRLLQKHCGLYWSESLSDAVEKGVDARQQKAKNAGKGRGRGKTDAEGQRMWLRGSEARIKGLVELVKMQQEAMAE
ncbi:MAG: hypothetical protein Q9174_000790 [Haloplaca sp. 1 TL-2023]